MGKNIGTMLRVFTTFEERFKAHPDSRSLEVANRLLIQIKELDARERQLRANVNLTPAGVFTELKKSVQNFWQSLGWFRDEQLANNQQLESRYRKLFVIPPSARNEVVQELRDSELRYEFLELTEADRIVTYLLAAEQNDDELMRAVQNAPGMSPLIPKDIRERGDQERAKRLDEVAYNEFRKASELRDELRIMGREIEDLCREFEVDVFKRPLTDAELSARIQAVIDAAFHPSALLTQERPEETRPGNLKSVIG